MVDHTLLQAQIYVAMIAEEGSFSRAARKLRTSQSSLTRRIAELEKALGMKLFDRSTRKLELTAVGRIVLPEIQLALRHSERAWELARYWERVENGPIHIGYSPYVNGTLLHKLYQLDLSELETQRAVSWDSGQPRFVLESRGTPELVEGVLRGELHFGFGVHPIGDEQLWVEAVAREPFCLCVPKNHELARRSSLCARDVHGELLSWIPRVVNPAFYDFIVEYIESTGAEPVYQEMRSATHAIEIVSHGFGLALLPSAAARLSYSGVVFRPVTDRFLRIETAMFAPRERLRGSLQDLVLFLISRLQGLKPNLQ